MSVIDRLPPGFPHVGYSNDQFTTTASTRRCRDCRARSHRQSFLLFTIRYCGSSRGRDAERLGANLVSKWNISRDGRARCRFADHARSISVHPAPHVFRGVGFHLGGGRQPSVRIDVGDRHRGHSGVYRPRRRGGTAASREISRIPGLFPIHKGIDTVCILKRCAACALTVRAAANGLRDPRETTFVSHRFLNLMCSSFSAKQAANWSI